jgi:nucleotide-binding universal stress UspA family protein
MHEGARSEMRQILVAMDDSEASERVADFVNRFFDGFDASTTAVNVGTATLGWGPYPAATGSLYPWPYWSYGMAVPPAGAPPRMDRTPTVPAKPPSRP